MADKNQVISNEELIISTDHHPDKFNKIQILSVEDLLDGKGINFTYSLFAPDTFKKATKKDTDKIDQIGMDI